MKRILILLLFMGLGQQLKAQEEFLKLDSVVMIKRNLNVSQVMQYRFYGIDSLTITTAPNQIVKVRSVAMEAISTNYGNISNVPRLIMYDSPSDASIVINGISVYDYGDFLFNRGSENVAKYVGWSKPDIFITSNQFQIVSTYLAYDYGRSLDLNFFSYIELVYYSYEN